MFACRFLWLLNALWSCQGSVLVLVLVFKGFFLDFGVFLVVFVVAYRYCTGSGGLVLVSVFAWWFDRGFVGLGFGVSLVV